MTKRIYFLMSLALAVLSACGGMNGDSLEFDQLTKDVERKLTNDKNSPLCKVHLQVNYASDSNGERARLVNDAIGQKLFGVTGLPIRQAVDSFANKYADDYIKNLSRFYQEDKGNEQRRPWYEYHYVATTSVRQGREGRVSVYLITFDYYEGGAHGINQQLTMNFDNKTGRLLTLDDIFVPGYEMRLNKILLKALRELVEAKDLRELHDKGYLYSMDMYASENFILDDEAITFVYNPYEIAPYALGSTELKIAYKALADILKDNY